MSRGAGGASSPETPSTVGGPFPAPTNPGADRAKDHEQKRVPPLPDPGRGGDVASFLRNRTTLGNGYLGSRIDEERSEMRYLV